MKLTDLVLIIFLNPIKDDISLHIYSKVTTNGTASHFVIKRPFKLRSQGKQHIYIYIFKSIEINHPWIPIYMRAIAQRSTLKS